MAIDFAALSITVKRDDVPKTTAELDKMAAAGKRAEDATNRLSGAHNSAGAASVAATRNMGAWSALTAEATGHVGEHSLALGRLGYRMESATSEALGLNSAMGLLGGSFLKFGVGDVYSIAILGGIYALTQAWESLTDPAREARKQIDDMTDALVKQARAAEEATIKGRANLSLIADYNAEVIKADTAGGFKSLIMRSLPVFGFGTGANTTAGDDASHAKAIADAATAQEQTRANEAKTRTEEAERAARELKRLQEEAAAAARKADEAFKAGINSGIAVFDNLASHGLSTSAVSRVLIDDYGTVADRIREMGTASGPAVAELLKLRDALMGNLAVSQAIAIANGTGSVGPLAGKFLPGVGITANGALSDAQGALGHTANVGFGDPHSPNGIQSRLDRAQEREAERIERLNDAYEHALKPFKSLDAAVTDFQQGIKQAATGLLEQFSPGNIAQGLVGGLTSKVEGLISGVIGDAVGGIRHALFGQNGAEKDAARQAADSAKAMALQMDAVTKALGGDQLGAALDALKIGLISTLQQINAALPGSKNEAQRNHERDVAAQQEAQNEANARRQYAEQSQYATEDLAVRNMRALGQGDQANLLAFKEQQARELQAALDANKDATYINNLKITENNELLAFLNGTLSDAVRNNPSGFYGSAAYLSQFASPFSGGAPANYPTDSGISHPNVSPLGGSNPAPARQPITLIFKPGALVMDKNGVMNVVLDQVDAQVMSTGGAGSSRAAAIETMVRR